MKTPTILVAVLALAGFAVASPTAHAANITMLNDTTAMITFDLRLTATLADHQLPILASSEVGYFDRVDIVGYSIEGATVTSANALLLSTQPVDGVRYNLEQDTDASFVLFILATLAEPLTTDLTATVTKIPYWVGERRTTVHQNQLDDLSTATTARD